MRTKICFGVLIIFLYFSFMLVACNKTDTNSKVSNTETTEISQPKKDKLGFDTVKMQTEKPDSVISTSKTVVSKLPKRREPQTLLSEIVSNSKLNGEQILLQEVLPENILLKNPDTIKYFLKNQYLGQERNFPRSIADNFEKGVSTERISYPKLYYRVELFEDEYSKKPYKVLSYSVRKEREKIIVE